MLQEEAAKEAEKARKAAEKVEKKESGRKSKNKPDEPDKLKTVEKKRKDALPSGGSHKRAKRNTEKPPATEKRSATEKPPVTPPAAGAVLPCFQRLQATGIDHFKVDVGNRKSFALKAPNGDQGSSVGVILTGNGSFYVYKAIETNDLGKLKAGL